MGIQMPLRKKVALIPHTRIQRNPHEIADDCHWSPFYLLIMMPNAVRRIAKAIGGNDYSLAVLCVSVCLCFLLLKFCLSRYRSLPKNEKSSQKCLLKSIMWFLYTVISFGFVHQFADFFPPETTGALYSVVFVCSSYLFYLFVIVDLVTYWKIWIHSEDETWLPEKQRLDAGKLNNYSVSISELV
ncbi:hypothetical protein L2E82_19466 [Cichorium intybus]|uniref:Uncharacterized protein n=1 Tax=Cichorium intybus TaxID=13427 RepID=A0ACB9FCB0_CICIN|nr:hypothetical protein L2E82_19466 [Cichorium intybus]